MSINSDYLVLYTHRLITIGEEWYTDVQIKSIDPSFDRATLPNALAVKHGWPIDNILVSNILEEPLPGVPVVNYLVGQRLRKLHLEGRIPGKWRKDLKVLIRQATGGLRANDPTEPDFK